MGITKGEIQNILRRYTTEELYEIQMFGVRKVMRKHTSFHRLQFLLKKIGMEVNDNHPKFIVVLYDEHDNYQQIKESFDRQTYPHKILKGIHDTTDEEQEMEYVTIFSDTYLYEEFHLEDMINGFKYTDVRFVTKDIKVTNHEIIPVKEHQFVETYSDSSLTMFALNHCSLSEWIRQFHEESHSFDKGYAIDGLEIQTVMKQINRRHHPKFSVIVPIYNNGDHLYGKCFLSLRRSSMFHEMEIILIDDGSTDSYTCKIVERLARKYSNIQTFFYPTGGSGSASRPPVIRELNLRLHHLLLSWIRIMKQ
ncbi:glycosyltransferase [Gracilibacillus boraciitolerans JCM 21714]|uniref:Glycosyltransferase n=1 Tax=Gracilibacillus boraciitolerans JCM 21714 TaxID=1298598 RepID=W4VH38_9BACI|nr:glycosyltransferase family A protein [Gracilibacillus boraciitolerans]GAE92456.1 glycosyltransferase [Gracilibacillus boraciitolerans JCM 21714]